jgi:hypothetical protein
MRKTGDATTSIGNFLTNLLSHVKEIDRLRKAHILNYFIGLGDDGLISKREMSSIKKLFEEVEFEHNMKSKVK